MISAILVTTAAFSLIIALRYLAVAGVAYWLFWGGGSRVIRDGQLNRRRPTWAAVRHELIASLISSPIYAFPAAVVIELWKRGGTALYLDPSAHGWWWLPVSAAIYLVAQDAFYYWAHRAMHDPRLFGWMHRGHHKSNDPTPFASFSFDPAEAAITAWFLPALTLFIPLQVYVAMGVLMFMTLTAVLNHAGREVWPDRWLDHPLLSGMITARHHDQHHKRFKGNYGLFFRWWDRWMGTELS